MILELRTRSTWTYRSDLTNEHRILAFTETSDSTIYDTCYWQWDMAGDTHRYTVVDNQRLR